MIRLGRIKTFLLGVAIIFLFYFVNRLNYIIGSETTTGRLMHYYLDEERGDHRYFPIVEYSWQGRLYRCRGRENTALELNKDVPVLLQKGDPYKPLIFTIGSFWLYPLFYVLLPLVLWAAFSLSFIGKGETLMFGWKYPFVKKDKGFFIDGPDLPRLPE